MHGVDYYPILDMWFMLDVKNCFRYCNRAFSGKIAPAFILKIGHPAF